VGLPKREDTRRDCQYRVLRVMDHIAANLDGELTLERLAQVAAFSPFHFHYIFRGLAGETVMDYVRRQRLERAWRRLSAGPAETVANAALDAGYSAEESFIRAFKAQFGLTPGEARSKEPPHPQRVLAGLASAGAPPVSLREWSVVERPAQRVVGLGLDCPGYDGSGIGALWGRLFARAAELPPTEHGIGAGLPRPDGYYYIAGWAVEEAGVPPQMEAATLPAAHYFRVPFHDQAPLLSRAFSTVFCELLPAAGLSPVYGPVCFEDYPPDCHDPLAGTLRCDLFVQLSGPSTYEPPVA
jgi:AraC-like DNA-binding protein/predicted transcriptional regulator YdeE